MEAVIFCGIQGSGKTTFYKEHFFKTHLRISLDMLHTRNKEARFLHTCFATGQRFVVDNTNPTVAERRRYIEAATQAHFKLIGYFFDTDVASAIDRNSSRRGKELIPIAGIKGTYKKLQPPGYEEGFNQLFKVQIHDGHFVVMPLVNPHQGLDSAELQDKMN